MGAFIFDTDVLSLVLRERPPTHLIRRLAIVPPADQFTTAVNLGEIVYGAAKAGKPDIAARARAAVLGSVTVLPFDEAAAEVYGELRANLERKGKPLAEPDLRIAAIALARKLTLVTGNTRHFARVPDLKIEDWTKEPA